MDVVVGIDVGGTDTKVALVGEDGRPLVITRVPTHHETGPAALVERCRTRIETLAAERGATPVALGIGVAGLVDRLRRVVEHAPNLPDWCPLDVEAVFAPLGLPTMVENDANVCALAEAELGAGVGAALLLCITLGTGVGGGVVERGRILTGARGMAGEFGHMRFIPDGHACGCGQHGCFEQYVNAGAVVRLAVEACGQEPQRVFPAWQAALSAGELSARHVGEAAAAGDEIALAVLREVGGQLGRGIGMLTNVLNPDRVVVSGGVALAGEPLLAAARAALAASVMPALAHGLEIRRAELGGDGGVLGAALLARGRRTSSECHVEDG